MRDTLFGKERGNIELLSIFLIIICSIVVVTIIQLSQTTLKSSQAFYKNEGERNTAISEGNYAKHNISKQIHEWFASSSGTISEDKYDYKLALNLNSISSLTETPSLYEKFYDFSGYEYAETTSKGERTKGYSFIKEEICEGDEFSPCRILTLVNVVQYKDKIFFASLTKQQFNFNIEVIRSYSPTYEEIITYKTTYTGNHKLKEVSGEKSVLRNLKQ